MFDCTRSEEYSRPGRGRLSPVPGFVGKRQMCFECRCSCGAVFLEEEVLNSPSRQTSWHSCHRSRTSAGGTGSEETHKLPANPLMTQANVKSKTLLSSTEIFFYLLSCFSKVYVCLSLLGYCKNTVVQHASPWRGTSPALITSSGMFI